MNGTQERLDLLVRWCQWMGLSPFRMERDAETGKFLGFRFTWTHPLTVWWLASKVLNAAGCVVWTRVFWGLSQRQFVEGGAKTTEKLVNEAVYFIYVASWLLTPELLVLRSRQLANASRHLSEFDRRLENLDGPPCSTRKWTVVGLVFNLSLVGTSLYTFIVRVAMKNETIVSGCCADRNGDIDDRGGPLSGAAPRRRLFVQHGQVSDVHRDSLR